MSVDFSRYWQRDKDAAVASCLIQGVPVTLFEKAAILYQALENHSILSPFVKEKNLQSKTVIVAQCGDRAEKVAHYLQELGIHPGDGYGVLKKMQLRFANFPAHSKEQFELLVDSLEKFK